MKLRNLFMAVVAGAAMLVGCNKEVDLGPAKLALDQTTLAFEAAGGSQTLNVTATRDWAVSGVPEWVALSATSGKAAVEAQPVKITVAQNTEYNRSATIVFTIGFARASLTIEQAGPEGEIDNGDGTLENPFNVAGVLEYTRSLPADQASEKNIFFEGKISEVSTTFEASGTYGNATFYVVDEDGGESFYVYQTYYLGNRKWKSGDTEVKQGDEVIICGKVVNFKGNTPETVSKGGSFIYSLNGKSEGGAPGDDDYTKAEAKTVAEFIELADESTYYKLTGKVSKFSSNYFSFDLTDASGTIYVYSVLDEYKTDEWKNKIKNGGTITIAGKYEYYSAKSQHEVVNAAILEYSDGEGGDEDYSKAEAKTVAEFIQLADKSTYYKLTGTVSKFNPTYCSFDLTDASGTIYVYSVLAAYKTDEWKNKIKDGGTITIAGKYEYYANKSQHEVVDAALLEYTDGEGGGDDYSTAASKTVAEFIQLADKNTYYKLTGTVSKFNPTYCSFDLTDASGTIYVYSVLAAYKTDEWKNKIKDGGTITIAGKYEYYANKSQHEVVDAAILEYTDGQGGGDEPGGDDYSTAASKTVAEFIQLADKSTYYKLTGTVSKFNPTYCSFDLTDASGTIYVYSVLAAYKTDEWKNKIKDGGTITIAGKYEYYANKSQHEVVDAAILEYTDGQGGGDEPGGDDYSTAASKTVAEFIQLADKSTYYKLTGTVSKFNPTYCSFDLTDASGTIYVYSVLAAYKTDEWKNKIKDGGTITIAGKYEYYANKSQHEVVDAAILEYTDGQGGGDEPGGDDYSTAASKTVEEFIQLADKNTYYKLTGTVSKFNPTYCSFDLTDASGTIYVYSVLAAYKTDEWKNKIKDGGTITIAGKYEYYANKSQHEVVDAAILEYTDGQGGGDEPAGTAYVLDKDAITAAHTSAWSYTSGSKTVTATDGSEWTLYNTYADKNQVTVQMNKGKGAYVLTPALPAGMEVKTIAVVLNTKKDGTGNMGDRPMDILNADGSSTLLAEQTGQTLADGVAVASGNSQVRIICNEEKGGAVYITSITVTYGAAE